MNLPVHRSTAPFVPLLAALLATGCYETKQEFTLNPDGSGKVVFDATFRPSMVNLALGEETTPEEKNRAAAASILEDSEGIDTWSDVAFTLRDDGRSWFRGTAYFRDVSRVKFRNLGDTRVTLEPGGSGDIILTVDKREKSDGRTRKPPKALSEQEIKTRIRKQRAEYRQGRPMLAAFLTGLRNDMTFHVPGTIRGGSNMKKTTTGVLHFVYDGMEVLKTLDELVESDPWMREQVLTGVTLMDGSPAGEEVMNEKLFGKRAPILAVLGGTLAPRFDYAAESAAARDGYTAMLKALGIRVVLPVVTPADGSGFTDVRVGGVRVVRLADKKRGIRPFHQDSGYAVCLVGSLPGAAVKIERGELDTAIADTGQNLLGEREWDRRAHFPRLSEDKTGVTLEFHLKLPDPEVRAIRELSGRVRYMVAGGVKEVDLGIAAFEAGVQGKELASSVKSVGESKWGDGQTLSIEIGLQSDAIKDIHVYGADGKELAPNGTSRSSSRDKTTLGLNFRDGAPSEGRIVVDMYEQQQRFEVPFKIENVSLLGVPLD